MASSVRIKTFPELLATFFAQLRVAMDDPDLDFNPGSALRTLAEAICLIDADQYVQIGLLKNLFSLFLCRGDDLDERALDYGAEINPEMKRLPANTAISSITVGDGTQTASTVFSADVAAGQLGFTVESGSSFPSSGRVVLSPGTAREESVVYFVSGNTFMTYTALQKGHAAGDSVVRTSTQSYLAAVAASGTSTITLKVGTGAAWAPSGTVILERGTLNQEKIAFTRVGDTLTLGTPLTFTHDSNTTAIQSTTGTDRAIASGTVCYVPATETSKQIDFRTTAAGTLLDGDIVSSIIPVESVLVGALTNVGAHTITKWAVAPFANATVTNPIAATRGRNREDDTAYVQRMVDFIQSLSRGTPLAVTTLTSGALDPVTNASVAFSQIVEPVAPGKSLLYITDGTSTFTLAQQQFFGRDVVISDAEINDRRGRLSQYGPFAYSETSPVTPRLFKSINRGTATSVGINYLEDTTQAMLTDYYVGAYLKTDDNQFYLITGNTAVRFTVDAVGATPSLGSYSIVDFGTNAQISSTSTATGANSLTDATLLMTVNAHVDKYLKDSAGAIWKITANTATVFTLAAGGATPASGAYTVTAGYPAPLTPGTDFTFNQTNGDLELALANALVAHDCLVAADDGALVSVGAYTYSTGLAAYVQRLVNGDPSDFTDFPGIRAAGGQIQVIAPVVVSETFVIKVVAAPGFTDADLTPAVQVAVQTTVNALGIGENVVLAKIVAAVMNLVGVADVQILSPMSNVIVPSGQLIRITDANVEVV